MAETATTASATIFPTTTDVVGGDVVSGLSAAGSGKTIGELAWRYLRANPYAGINYVRQGTYALVSGRTFRYNSTIAQIAGYLVLCDTTAETLTTEASDTCYTWLQLVRNASGQVTGARWVVSSTETIPALPTNGITGDQVMLGYQTANASAITAQGSTYRGYVQPGTRIATATPNTANSGAVASIDINSIPLVGDGVTTYCVQGKAYVGPSNSGVATTMQVRDAAAGGGSVIDTAAFLENLAGGALTLSVDGDVAPFWGAKTLYLYATAPPTMQHYGGIAKSRFYVNAT